MKYREAEGMLDMCYVHGIGCEDLDKEVPQELVDLWAKNREESIKREAERKEQERQVQSNDTSSWENINRRFGDWVYHEAQMGEESSSGWSYDPPEMGG